MTAKRILAVFLAVAVGQHAAQAQTSGTATGGKEPAAFTIRDNQGKTVHLPKPNPAQPINYIQWTNQTLGSGLTDNAADLYGKACRLHKTVEVKEDELDKALTGPWQNLESVSAWLTANRSCMETFREATTKRQCYLLLGSGGSQGDGVETRSNQEKNQRTADLFCLAMLPDMSAMRDTCKALITEGWREWAEGNESRVLDNALVVLRNARHLDDQPTTIQHLVGTAGATLSYSTLLRAMSLSRDPGALAGRLAGRLAVSDPPLELSKLRWAAFEHASFWDVCQRLFVPGKKPGTWEVMEGLQKQFDDASSVLASIDPENKELFRDIEKQLAQIGYEATLREGDEVSQRLQSWLEKPFSSYPQEGEAIEKVVEQSNNPLVKMLMSSLARVRVFDERRIAHRRATHLTVQLLVHQAKNHAFPEKLDELKAPNLKEIRVDPFSGKDFVYKKQGEGFLLYSVGEDLKDGGGGKHDKLWKQDDFVFWPVQTKSKAQ